MKKLLCLALLVSAGSIYSGSILKGHIQKDLDRLQ